MRLIFFLCVVFMMATCQARAGVSDAQLAEALERSDDLAAHGGVFLSASRDLVLKGWCTLDDLRLVGGWARRAAGGGSRQNIYLTYCGGTAAKNRIYLDVRSGRTYR